MSSINIDVADFQFPTDEINHQGEQIGTQLDTGSLDVEIKSQNETTEIISSNRATLLKIKTEGLHVRENSTKQLRFAEDVNEDSKSKITNENSPGHSSPQTLIEVVEEYVAAQGMPFTYTLKSQKSRFVCTETVLRTKSGKLQQVAGYNVVEELGRGAFGTVHKVEKFQDGVFVPYAMKVFTDNKIAKGLRKSPCCKAPDDNHDLVLREIAIMKKLNHPHLIHLEEVIEETAATSTLYIIMEYADEGPIMHIRKKTDPTQSPIFYTPLTETGVFGEAQASRLFRELLSGMAYLHLNNIAHRDLKPDNVMLTDKISVKIVDFGVSRCFDQDRDNSSVRSYRRGLVQDTQGTWPFWAPEMCEDNDYHNENYDGDDDNQRQHEDQDDHDNGDTYSAYKADVWAAGVVLWTMLFGTLPFYGTTPDDIFQRICGPPPEPPNRKSPEVITMLSKMLTRDPASRPNFIQCETMSWIQQHSNQEIERAYQAQSVRVDASDLNIQEAVTNANIVSFSELFKKKLRSKVAEIKITVQERNTRRVSSKSVSQDNKKKNFMEDKSGSSSFMLDSIASSVGDRAYDPSSQSRHSQSMEMILSLDDDDDAPSTSTRKPESLRPAAAASKDDDYDYDYYYVGDGDDNGAR
eukprot:gene2733-5381_t